MSKSAKRRLGPFLAASVTIAIISLTMIVAYVARTSVPVVEPLTERKQNGSVDTEVAERVDADVGLLMNGPTAFEGYTLIAPLKSPKTYLIDMNGKVVRTWESDFTPGLGAYLLENGHLLRTASLGGPFGDPRPSPGPGAGGRIQEFAWDGDLCWDLVCVSATQIPHHDIARLPNGNILVIVWDRKTDQEAIAAGRRPNLVEHTPFWPDGLIEIKQTGRTTGEVVWEWHLWDHLIQDHDRTKSNYGNVAEHPELVDINFHEHVFGVIARRKRGMDKLRAIGYVGNGGGSGAGQTNPVWSHINCVAFNAELNQIMLTSLTFSEFWIIDHSTTAAEAASHTGGRSGKGGDILYRWGNPRTYRAGTEEDQRLFAAHNAHWIPRGLPGAGHVLVFNNGSSRPSGHFSSVEEIAVPADKEGRYRRDGSLEFGPDQPLWTYRASERSSFFSALLSGAQRLPNGNTLICSGVHGTVFEVNPMKEMVWKYTNPVKSDENSAWLGQWSAGALFRAYRYESNYPGLVGKDLTPGRALEESFAMPVLDSGR